MKHTQIFTKTKRDFPSDEVAKNAQLLIKAGFIYKEMAGVYSYLPFGLKVLNKIENILRKHMNTIANELLLSALAPKELWETTNRLKEVDVLFKATAANENSKNKSANEYILNSTHEEIITPIAIEYGQSYKNFPFAFYQIQTKFRNEPRAKSGILRGREFRMKDLYSFHTSTENFVEYYENVKQVYLNFFNELGLGKDTFVTTASGGDFTDKLSHEFQVVCDAGEDTIYINPITNLAYNEEVIDIEITNNNLKKEDLNKVKACEVGNIFTLFDRFTKDFNFTYKDEKGENQLVKEMGCYGIGTTRVMGVLVEKFADEKGLVWSKNIAPFEIELVSLHKEMHDKVYDTSERIYNELESKFDILWDDRHLSPGQKLNDADLYGCPVQVIIGEKSLAEGVVEIKNRKTGEISKIEINLILNYLNHIWPNIF